MEGYTEGVDDRGACSSTEVGHSLSGLCLSCGGFGLGPACRYLASKSVSKFFGDVSAYFFLVYTVIKAFKGFLGKFKLQSSSQPRMNRRFGVANTLFYCIANQTAPPFMQLRRSHSSKADPCGQRTSSCCSHSSIPRCWQRRFQHQPPNTVHLHDHHAPTTTTTRHSPPRHQRHGQTDSSSSPPKSLPLPLRRRRRPSLARRHSRRARYLPLPNPFLPKTPH